MIQIAACNPSAQTTTAPPPAAETKTAADSAQAAASAQAGNFDYFKGKTVTYIIATGPGGGYDSYGRLSQTSNDGGAQAVTYTYDTAGGVTVTDATGRQTFLAFGLGGQLAQVRDSAGRVDGGRSGQRS